MGLHGGVINHDGGSTSVEGGAARESLPARGAAVKLSYHKTQPLPVISGLVKQMDKQSSHPPSFLHFISLHLLSPVHLAHSIPRYYS